VNFLTVHQLMQLASDILSRDTPSSEIVGTLRFIRSASPADIDDWSGPWRNRYGVQGVHLNPWASSYAPPYRVLVYGVF
jgi:hypothetical protein